MSLEAINAPRIIWRKESSICLNWENVFPVAFEDTTCLKGVHVSPSKTRLKSDRIYNLHIQIAPDEWRVAYWGKKYQTVVTDLKPCTSYNFKIKLTHADNSDGESHWFDFKAATSTEQFHVHHLCRAIKYSKVPLIRKIISNKYYLLETPNLEDKTPLMQATELGNLHVVTFLCNLGAHVNAQSRITQRTALMLALFYGFIDIAKYLLEKKANIDMKDTNERTALYYAIDGNHLEAVRFAINHNADVNLRDNKGWTPLLRAVILETQIEIIKLLLAKGSDQTAVDSRGLDFRKHLELTNRLHILK